MIEEFPNFKSKLKDVQLIGFGIEEKGLKTSALNTINRVNSSLDYILSLWEYSHPKFY